MEALVIQCHKHHHTKHDEDLHHYDKVRDEEERTSLGPLLGQWIVVGEDFLACIHSEDVHRTRLLILGRVARIFIAGIAIEQIIVEVVSWPPPSLTSPSSLLLSPLLYQDESPTSI